MARVAKAAKDNGLVAGAFAGTADGIKAYRKLGYTFLAAAVDVDLLQAGAAALMKSIEGV
jgi:2-keto-3-deoxy-L-rhamnonate aldolase RhmA